MIRLLMILAVLLMWAVVLLAWKAVGVPMRAFPWLLGTAVGVTSAMGIVILLY